MDACSLSWSRNGVEEEALRRLFGRLGAYCSLVEDGEGIAVSARLGGEGLRVERSGDGARIVAGSVSLAARGLGMLLSGMPEEGGVVEEKAAFQTVGVMFDCCRNAVLKVEYLKEWLCRAALMGYNLAMVYTKDTYVLPDEEGFGYLRGSYSADELRELDAFAGEIGIEMVGCVQALGHLEPVLKWGKYSGIRDTDAELLTTEEKSYELINKILDFFGSVFKSRRIHLGMDETHGLGRGRYMDINGYRRPFDIYVDHLNRVMGECETRGLEPMIWSDMFFRMGSKGMDYYDHDAVTPPDVIEKIPPGVDLVYWDYYHEDVEFYREWIRRHHGLGHKPVMASGIWTWPVFWYNHGKTVATVRPCVEACVAEGVDEIFFTMWGDDGGYCDWSSALAGACYAAEKCFDSEREPDEEMLSRKFAAICGSDYRGHLVASELTVMTEGEKVSAECLLWDDPLLGIYWKDCEAQYGAGFWRGQEARYGEIASRLEGCEEGDAGNLRLAGDLARLLEMKIRAVRAAEGVLSDSEKARGAGAEALAVADALEAFEAGYREQWYRRNKTFGYEVMQVRLAGQVARWKELHRRLEEIADGTSDGIPEMRERIGVPVGVRCQYHFLATASVYY